MAQVISQTPSAPTQTQASNPPFTAPTIDYAVIRNRLKEFLTSFALDDFTEGSKLKYMTQIEEIFRRTRKTLSVEVEDLYKWGMVAGSFDDDSRRGATGLLHDDVVHNARRYQELFSEAADSIIDEMRANANDTDAPVLDPDDPDNIAVLVETRRQREQAFRQSRLDAENMPAMGPDAQNAAAPAGPGADPRNLVPAIMTRTYQTVLIPRPLDKCVPLRYVRANNVGQLVSVTGVVTRVTEVKPRVVAAAYVCYGCGYEVYQEVTGRSYMPVLACPTQNHPPGSQDAQLVPNYTGCKYVKYQELKLQEAADQVPVGNIPRTMSVKLNGELTRTCTSGDVVKISGIFLPVPYTGYRAMKAGFLADTFLEATNVVQLKKSYDDEFIDEDTKHDLLVLRHDPNVYDRIAKSIAPEIFGSVDVKKALLLLLLGAPPKRLPDGMRLRGDLHICLMGDPGVAKSQFLKHITKIAPRAVYTTGKGSSGVGLTAAVMRDPVTNELMLEGGALVLADMGIACIDEFDKMNETDRTAIHEVMEQQTVSIAKAGITTSLNARTSVLAASNPAYGRYNRNKAPAENINLPAALLSRFDLLFLLLDVPQADQDIKLARHVTHVHRTGAHPMLGFDVVDPKVIRAHIAEARKVNPTIPKNGALTEYLVSNYVAMRTKEIEEGREAKEYTSPRVLLSVLRLAQALCRLRLSETVERADVDEALRLMEASKASLGTAEKRKRRDDDADELDLDALLEKDDDNSPDARSWKIYSLISEYMERENRTVVDISTAEKLCEDNNYTREELMKTIDEYEDMDIWTYDTTEHRIAVV